MAKMLCARNYYPNNYPSGCIELTTKRMITPSKTETACNYALDVQKCNTCATIVKLKQKTISYGLIGLSIFLPLISLVYILVSAGFYFFKKRALGPKWQLIIASLVLILSSLLFFYLRI